MLVRILCWASLAAPLAAQARVVSDLSTEPDSVLTGTVVSLDGLPVGSASVELRTRTPKTSTLRGSATTQPDGRFQVRVAPLQRDGYMRDSFLEVEAPGMGRSHLERVYLPSPTYDVGAIVVYPPVDLIGRVTNTEGRPVEGAAIHAALGAVIAPYGDHARRSAIAVTNSNGEYACRVLAPGITTLGASAIGFADRVLERVEIRGEGANRADFVMDPERIVRLDVASMNGARLQASTAEPLGERDGEEPWATQSRYRAFWRTSERADQDGVISLRGIDEDYVGHVLVTAPDHRPELVALTGNQHTVHLEPVTWIEVVATRNDGGPPPELYEVVVRDNTRPASWCGNCDASRLAYLWKDSPAVKRVAPNYWRIAWNSRGCYIDGGRPSEVSAVSTDRTHARAYVSSLVPGTRVERGLDFDAPSRLQGTVVDESGAPVSLRLGVQLSMQRSDWLCVESGADGKFEFGSVGAGVQFLHCLDDRWRLDAEVYRVELVSGRALQGIFVSATSRPDGRTGRVRGVLRIAGKTPEQPVLLALDEVEYQHLPDAFPRGFAWTDRDGRFEISAPWPREYHILPKHRPPSAANAWRDFAREFPAHGSDWKWKVTVPDSGTTEAVIDLPPESEWDAVAPSKSR